MQRQQWMASAGAGPSGVTKPWHPCIESDMYHILNRHAATPETIQKRREVLNTLQAATKSIAHWRAIDVSPWTYSFETEESVLQVAIATTTTPGSVDASKSSGETSTQHQRSKKKPTNKANSRKSPDPFRQLESLLPGISPYLQIQGEQSQGLPESVECSVEGMELDFLPPSPYHAPLNALLSAYRWHYQPLHALVPFLDLWLRSWDVEPDELGPHCLALLVLTYLRAEWGLDDLLRDVDGSALEEAVRDLEARGEKGKVNDALANATAAEVVFRFFKFIARDDITTKLLSIRTRVLSDRKKHEESDPNPSTESTKPPIYVQDPFLPFHNHAADLSRTTWARLQTAAKRAIRELDATAPLHCIFGSAVDVVHSLPPITPFLDPLIEVAIQRMIAAQAPDASIRAARQRTIKAVDQAIRTAFGDKYVVQCFGSTQYGVDSATSDLDMIILDPDLARGWNPKVRSEDLPGVYNMRKVGWALQDGGFQRVIAITGATVPIVKFYDERTKLNVDLNCNNTLGCVNTVLLANYCNAWAPLRSMIFFVKKWAKSWALNDPSGSDGPSSYSSYCLTLMIVGYLQTRGVLPNLQANAVGHQDKETTGFWSKMKKDKRLWSDTRFESFGSYLRRGWKGRSMTLSEALYGFYRYFAFEFKYDEWVLDVKRGGLMRREVPTVAGEKAAAKVPGIKLDGGEVVLVEDVDGVPTVDTAGEGQPADWAKSKFVVVDPFIRIKNCANGVSERVNERFIQECERAMFILEAGQPIDALLGEYLPLFPGENKPRRPPLRELQPRPQSRKRKSNSNANPRGSVSSQPNQSQRLAPPPAPAANGSGFPDPAASPISFTEFLERMRTSGGVRRQPPSPGPSASPLTSFGMGPDHAQVNDVYYPSMVNPAASSPRRQASNLEVQLPRVAQNGTMARGVAGSSTRMPYSTMTTPFGNSAAEHFAFVNGSPLVENMMASPAGERSLSEYPWHSAAPNNPYQPYVESPSISEVHHALRNGPRGPPHQTQKELSISRLPPRLLPRASFS